jgi:nucleotide-binding universal stress UspA family protein
MLYQLLTAELPFGEPTTTGGLRQRLWMDPKPVRQLNPDVPEWLQEIVMRCLESVAANRYPSAAHLAFDLRHPQQVKVTARGKKIKGTSFTTHFKRWIKAAGMQYEPSPLATEQIESVPIVMVAVPHQDVTDATLYSLRQAVERSLGIRPGAQLACVTVISGTSASNNATSETTLQRHYLNHLKQWTQGLDLSDHQVSYHVLESGDVAQALIEYAKGNHVSVLVMGATTHGLPTQRWLATVPIKVAMDAPCTVILVKQALPFDKLLELADQS